MSDNTPGRKTSSNTGERASHGEPKKTAVPKTVFHQQHVALGGKMVPFGGWEMPVQYPTGIFAEHRATRIAASLFDVSHMSVFEFQGSQARSFLDALLAGKVVDLAEGRAAYNYILRPDGTAIDDTFLYHVGPEHYFLVVNASNAPADWEWIQADVHGAVVVPASPDKKMPGPVSIRDLRHAGADSRILIAFQGPKSEDILKGLADSDAFRTEIGAMKRNDVRKLKLHGTDVLLAKTGYTGEMTGYEIFLHPDIAPEMWDAILDAGRPHGVLPAGLGARDAARLEAGLPLFGHELEGENRGTLTEAGYTWVITADKWFIGRDAYLRRFEEKPARKLVRLSGQGAKTVRGGHVILNDDGRAAGVVTSFAFLDEKKNFMVLAYVDAELNDAAGYVVRAARMKEVPLVGGEDISVKFVDLKMLKRFPDKAERDQWRKFYGG